MHVREDTYTHYATEECHSWECSCRRIQACKLQVKTSTQGPIHTWFFAYTPAQDLWSLWRKSRFPSWMHSRENPPRVQKRSVRFQLYNLFSNNYLPRERSERESWGEKKQGRGISIVRGRCKAAILPTCSLACTLCFFPHLYFLHAWHKESGILPWIFDRLLSECSLEWNVESSGLMGIIPLPNFPAVSTKSRSLSRGRARWIIPTRWSWCVCREAATSLSFEDGEKFGASARRHDRSQFVQCWGNIVFYPAMLRLALTPNANNRKNKYLTTLVTSRR